jgi:hypothetical protein
MPSPTTGSIIDRRNSAFRRERTGLAHHVPSSPGDIGSFLEGMRQGAEMGIDGRLVAVILEVSDLDRSVALYRDAFGLDLHPGDNGVDDRWTGGKHAEISWREGAYLHFSPIRPRGSLPVAHRSLCQSTILTAPMRRQCVQVLTFFTNHVRSLGVEADGMKTSTAM